MADASDPDLPSTKPTAIKTPAILHDCPICDCLSWPEATATGLMIHASPHHKSGVVRPKTTLLIDQSVDLLGLLFLNTLSSSSVTRALFNHGNNHSEWDYPSGRSDS
jgi:hypothetical protein